LLGDRLAVWVISRLILATETLGQEGGEEKDWQLLRELGTMSLNCARPIAA
jgi:hypothetical protein